MSRPRVTDFLDVVMHARETELLLEQIKLAADSALVGLSLGDAHVRDRTGAPRSPFTTPVRDSSRTQRKRRDESGTDDHRDRHTGSAGEPGHRRRRPGAIGLRVGPS